MKTIIFGDIHGRTVWKDVIESQEWDRVIFLGDYVSTHEEISERDQISNLLDILEFKEQDPDRVILLRGNHDMQHLMYWWGECSGFFRKVGEFMCGIRERFLADTQWCLIEENVIYSHAGISKTWLESTSAQLDKINELRPSELFGFTPERYGDWCGESKTQPLTWIRPRSLISDKLDGYTQVVGHTTVSHISCISDVYLCDCLPQEYLVCEDGEFTTKII